MNLIFTVGKRLLPLVAVTTLWAAGTAPSYAQAAAPCQFVLGFQTLHNMSPADIGDCLDNQSFAANGDAQQHTTKGLMAWRKADNWTAFTNGYMTWINGPGGLVSRLNTDRFAWEHDVQLPNPATQASPIPDCPIVILKAYDGPIEGFRYPSARGCTEQQVLSKVPPYPSTYIGQRIPPTVECTLGSALTPYEASTVTYSYAPKACSDPTAHPGWYDPMEWVSFGTPGNITYSACVDQRLIAANLAANPQYIVLSITSPCPN